MSFSAEVLRVLIASPSDVCNERNAVEEAIYKWNRTNAQDRGVVLLPWRWEKDAVPGFGEGPQEVINQQVEDTCDIVIALFGNKVGTATSKSRSGTVEEIDRAVAAEKPVHVYFSVADIPRETDINDLIELDQFKDSLRTKCLYGEYDSPAQLEDMTYHALASDVRTRVKPDDGAPREVSEKVSFRVQPSIDGSNRIVEVTNVGETTAEQVEFTVNLGENSALARVRDEPAVPIAINPGVSRTFKIIGGSKLSSPTLTLSWTENGKPYTKDFDL